MGQSPNPNKKDHEEILCFLRLKKLPCAKSHVSKEYLTYYECEKCLWRIRNNTPEALKRMEKLFERYHKV
jgi:hypothetical protein